MPIEYFDGDAVATLEDALGRVPLVPGPNGRVALITGLHPGEVLTAASLDALLTSTDEAWAKQRAVDAALEAEAITREAAKA